MDSSQHPLEAMVIERKASTPPEKQKTTQKKPKAPDKIEFSESRPIAPNTIDLDQLNRPALLFNSRLKIVWQNTKAIEQIWHSPGARDQSMPGLDVFDLCFDPVFKRNVANFKACIAFFLHQICQIISEKELRKRIEMINDDRKKVILSLMDRMTKSDSSAPFDDRYLYQTLRNGDARSFEVMAINFNEGRLMVFELQRNTENLIPTKPHSGIEKQHSNTSNKKADASKTSYVLLAAQLNKASIFRTQMLADEYRRLVNDLCQRSLYKIEQHGGIFGKHIESGFYAYFLSDPETPVDILNIIECALDLKKLMIDLGREWKIRKNWLHDIELNIGLHWEHEYVDMLSSSTGDVITSFGDGLQVAAVISQLARNGQIWATKSLIQQLTPDLHKQLRFGILRPNSSRRQPFIRNGFARIKEVFDTGKSDAPVEEGFDIMPVTQIFDLSGFRA